MDWKEFNKRLVIGVSVMIVTLIMILAFFGSRNTVPDMIDTPIYVEE